MSKITRRGYQPEDDKIFSEEQCMNLRKAAQELGFLLDAGYPLKPASTFISNHYMFQERQRLALVRTVSSTEAVCRRKIKQITEFSQVQEVHIDGFNTIITMEVALSHSPILKCMDGTVRDLAGLRGTYRIIDKTEKAILLMFDWLQQTKISRVTIYLDAPVSNSGRLKVLLYELSENYDFQLSIEVINDVDRRLEQMENVITSDAIILDRCLSWINLFAEAGACIRDTVWMVDFI